MEKQRILIAEDDEIVLSTLCKMLEIMGEGYEVVAVRDGKEALAKIMDKRFNL